MFLLLYGCNTVIFQYHIPFVVLVPYVLYIAYYMFFTAHIWLLETWKRGCGFQRNRDLRPGFEGHPGRSDLGRCAQHRRARASVVGAPTMDLKPPKPQSILGL